MSFFWLHFPTCIIPYNLSYFFLINFIPFVLVLFLFTIIQILIDFSAELFLFGFKSFEEECSKIHRTFFFLDTLRGCVSKQLTPKVSDHCCFEIVKEIAYRESRLQKHS